MKTAFAHNARHLPGRGTALEHNAQFTGHASLRRRPALAGRLNQPIVTRAEAIRQLAGSIPITDLAKRVLAREQKHHGKIHKTRNRS